MSTQPLPRPTRGESHTELTKALANLDAIDRLIKLGVLQPFQREAQAAIRAANPAAYDQIMGGSARTAANVQAHRDRLNRAADAGNPLTDLLKKIGNR